MNQSVFALNFIKNTMNREQIEKAASSTAQTAMSTTKRQMNMN